MEIAMAGLISRAAAIEYLMTNMGWHDDDGYEVEDADEKRKAITGLVNGIPAVDAAPVVHGRWIKPVPGDGEAYCSNCKHDALPCGYYLNPALMKYYETAYCPNCGAKMDGEREGDSE